MHAHGLRSFLLALAVSFLAGCCCPRNPLPNTAVAAHGNTDWHIDTANEFLFGTDMGGSTTAANHCPDAWTRRHIHTGLTSTAHFYADPSRATPGDDKDATNGIDTAMLFFYAGHGNPVIWNTLGDNGTQGSCLLGECRNRTAGLRYYWQCSCEVFAHGLETCPSGMLYGCPGSFDGSADSATMRNVYERWGPVLSPELRMACGASTLAYCHETQANAIWDGFNNKGLDVADSFIEGLSGWGVVPLCITTGGPDVTKTPLYDTAFTSAANDSGTSYYHIQWASSFARRRRSPLIALPPRLPVYELRPLKLPEPLATLKLERRGEMLVATETSGTGGLTLRVNSRSGAIYLTGPRTPPTAEPRLSESRYVETARRFLGERGLWEASVAEPEGTGMMLQSRPVAKDAKPGVPVQKGVTYIFRRIVKAEGRDVPVLGDGGAIEVGLNPDGSVQRVTKVWREIVGVKRVANVKTYDQALGEAERQLGEGTATYALDAWDFGYKEADGNAAQDEMRAVFRFTFVPKNRETMLQYPPRLVEVPGQVD